MISSEAQYSIQEYVDAWQEQIRREAPLVKAASRSVYRFFCTDKKDGGVSNLILLPGSIGLVTAHSLSYDSDPNPNLNVLKNLIYSFARKQVLSPENQPLLYFGDPGERIVYASQLKPDDFALMKLQEAALTEPIMKNIREVQSGETVYIIGHCDLDNKINPFLEPLIIPTKAAGVDNHLLYVESEITNTDFSGISGGMVVDQNGDFLGMVFCQWPSINAFIAIDSTTIFTKLEEVMSQEVTI